VVPCRRRDGMAYDYSTLHGACRPGPDRVLARSLPNMRFHSKSLFPRYIIVTFQVLSTAYFPPSIFPKARLAAISVVLSCWRYSVTAAWPPLLFRAQTGPVNAVGGAGIYRIPAQCLRRSRSLGTGCRHSPRSLPELIDLSTNTSVLHALLPVIEAASPGQRCQQRASAKLQTKQPGDLMFWAGAHIRPLPPPRPNQHCVIPTSPIRLRARSVPLRLHAASIPFCRLRTCS
jgi:hypothetical protein